MCHLFDYVTCNVTTANLCCPPPTGSIPLGLASSLLSAAQQQQQARATLLGSTLLAPPLVPSGLGPRSLGPAPMVPGLMGGVTGLSSMSAKPGVTSLGLVGASSSAASSATRFVVWCNIIMWRAYQFESRESPNFLQFFPFFPTFSSLFMCAYIIICFPHPEG